MFTATNNPTNNATATTNNASANHSLTPKATTRLENQDIPNQVSKAVDEIVTDAVDWAMQEPLRKRFRDLPEVDMKEILHNRIWESKSYQTHEDRMMLYKALEKSMARDNRPSGTSGASGASGSSQSPPPPPPPSNNQGDVQAITHSSGEDHWTCLYFPQFGDMAIIHGLPLYFSSDLRGRCILRYNVSNTTTLGGDQVCLVNLVDEGCLYPDVGLEQMVPDQMWIEEECKYDVAVMAVRTHMRILSVVRIEGIPNVMGYQFMKKIVLRRA
ncbi:hypothetical protein Tco_0006860 [Tanacetum coccineum]